LRQANHQDTKDTKQHEVRGESWRSWRLGGEGVAVELEAKLNVDDGAIALGHPVGASGGRAVFHLSHVLKRNGGQGGAMMVEASWPPRHQEHQAVRSSW
jgi:acetyl-CoA acetyltransferase